VEGLVALRLAREGAVEGQGVVLNALAEGMKIVATPKKYMLIIYSEQGRKETMSAVPSGEGSG